MKNHVLLSASLIVASCFAPWAASAQQTAAAATLAAPVVPNVISYSGTLIDLNGKPLTSLQGAGYPVNCSVFYCTPSRCSGCPACEPNFFTCS